MTDDRLRHSLAVATKMKDMASEGFKADMFILGFLHDIGYEFCDDTKKHNLIGGLKLKEGGYKYWQEVYYHGEHQTQYSSAVLDLLNKADLMTGPQGQNMSACERLEDIAQRYGKDSHQYRESFLLAKKLGVIR